jgi:GNAT superfamily N-acetyltransferase
MNVVNEAAEAYSGVIPKDCWKEPYMSAEELAEELGLGVEFFGYFEGEALLGVMGIQLVRDVTLIRHAYVLSSHQRKGIGENLLRYLLALAQTREILVGTWAAAWWALRFYQKNGFSLLPEEASQCLLSQYWTIPKNQAVTSVVLKLGRKDAGSR